MKLLLAETHRHGYSAALNAAAKRTAFSEVIALGGILDPVTAFDCVWLRLTVIGGRVTGADFSGRHIPIPSFISECHFKGHQSAQIRFAYGSLASRLAIGGLRRANASAGDFNDAFGLLSFPLGTRRRPFPR